MVISPNLLQKFTNSQHTLLCSQKNIFRNPFETEFYKFFSVRVISLLRGTWHLKLIHRSFIRLHVGEKKLTEAERWTIIQCVNKSENGQCKLVLSAVRKHSLMSSLHSVPLICHKAINTKIPEKKSYSSLLFFAVYLHFRNSKSLFLWI